MAVRSAVITEIKGFGEYAHQVVWEGLLNGDTGSPIAMPGHVYRSIQFKGTFGAGGTVVFEGSNDGVTYATLNDLQGSAISKTGAAIEGVAELTYWVRPSVTAGDGTTDIDAIMILRRGV